MTVSATYRHTGLVMVRVTTDPGDLDLPAHLGLPTHLGLSDPTAIHEQGRPWLAKIWARSDVRTALRVASPALATRLDQLFSDDAIPCSTKELWRVTLSVASYLLRWQRRATPFGMFAGITIGAVGPVVAEVGVSHRIVVRADAEWLTMLIDQLERHPGLRPRLTVVANSERIVRDGRVIVHPSAAVGASTPGPLRESSVLFNRPVQFALAAADSPIRFDALAAHMTSQFSSASPDKINAVLHGLVDGGLLITSLRPPMTTVDALSHLVDVLRAAEGENLTDIAAQLSELDEISAHIACHNRTTDRELATATRDSIVEHMNTVVASPGPALATDTLLDARIAVPERVLNEAALAASVLLRVTTQPFGSAAWLDYHARFRTRYGPGALVPVRDLVADSGLGYPAGYLGAPRAKPAWRTLTDRDAALLRLIQQAVLDGADEIELTDADIEALTVGDHRDTVAPQRVELGVAVHAASTSAIDRGDFQLLVTAAPRTPTSMAGRFAYLLNEDDRVRLAATYSVQRGTSEPGPVAMQLSFPARLPHNENVVRVPPLLTDIVSLAEHPDPSISDLNVVSVDDLAVTADAEQMYLVERSSGRRVVPRIPHALDTYVQTPPLARFLAEVADARSAVFSGFDLGAARTLPYVPRIRYRRTVLCPARWILTPADLAAHAGNEATKDECVGAWRQRRRVPTRVVLCDGQLRLPLDLDQELDRALLLAHTQRAERIELHEDGPPDSQGWIGRPAELLIPMVAIDPPARPLPATAVPGAVLRPGDSAVLHAQLVGNPARFDELIATHLPRLVYDLGDLIGRWWMRRHRDMIHPEADQHVAVFLRLASPQHYGPAAAKVAAFVSDLETRGLPGHLTLASVPQHPARYGVGQALTAAEEVFAADTAAAIAQVKTAHANGIPAQALAAVSMAYTAACFAPDRHSGYQALLECLRQQHGSLDRALRDCALNLADPDEDYRAVRALAGGEALAAAWTARAAALTSYHQTLAQQRDPGTVLRTLLHEHHIRAVGVDPAFERQTERLARAIALRHLALAGVR